MWLIDKLAEARIAEAEARGELRGLPGEGRPVELDDDALVPEHLRAAYRLLRNSGHLPPEAAAYGEIREAEALARRAVTAEQGAAGGRRGAVRLSLLMARLAATGREAPAWTREPYAGRVAERLAGRHR